MYLRVKVPKKGSVIIQLLILALLILILGGIWWILLPLAIGSILVEMISQPQKKDFKKLTLGYISYGVLMTLISNLSPVITADYYYNSAVASGMDVTHVKGIMDALTIPVIIVSVIAAVICCILGAFLGRKMLKKHFDKISA